MNYSIKVNKLEKENWSTKAFVSVVFEESLKVTDITIRETKKEKYSLEEPPELFLSSRKNLKNLLVLTASIHSDLS